MYNIIYKTNTSLWNKTFSNGLNKYTQPNCQVTLTDDGYRIYRPPNKTQSADGNTMWGGLILNPFSADANALVKGHTYIVAFDIKGKTSGAATDVYWSNNAGWGGGSYGLGTSPTNVQYTAISAGWNYDTWQYFQYKFTVSDDIMKTCTKSYSSFVEGNQYNTYRDFKFGFTYTNTGELGTDLYLRNFRLYDITTPSNEIKLEQTGVFNSGNLIENNSTPSLKIDGDNYMNNFIEW